MTREKIIFETEEEMQNIAYENPSDYTVIERDTVYFDLEKEYEDVRIIFKRKSDGKFFEFTYMDSSSNGFEIDNLEAIEVFATIIQKTVYN